MSKKALDATFNILIAAHSLNQSLLSLNLSELKGLGVHICHLIDVILVMRLGRHLNYSKAITVPSGLDFDTWVCLFELLNVLIKAHTYSFIKVILLLLHQIWCLHILQLFNKLEQIASLLSLIDSIFPFRLLIVQILLKSIVTRSF